MAPSKSLGVKPAQVEPLRIIRADFKEVVDGFSLHIGESLEVVDDPSRRCPLRGEVQEQVEGFTRGMLNVCLGGLFREVVCLIPVVGAEHQIPHMIIIV